MHRHHRRFRPAATLVAPVATKAALLAVVATIAIAGAVAGCALGSSTDDPSPSASPTPTVPPVRVTITPRDGVQRAHPENGIAVRVKHGTLVSVKVRTSGDPVTGSLNTRATTWTSRWTLNVDTRYEVKAVVRDEAGQTVTETSTFRTLAPAHAFACEIWQARGASYGVGMPIMLHFSSPISDRRAVESALTVFTSRRVVGAWYWNGDQDLFFRPRAYWQPGTKVGLVARLNGVEGAPGVYGTHTLRQNFRIGRSLIVVADTQSHRCRVYLDRRSYANWPMSSGKSGDETPNGTYLTIEKGNPTRMKGEGYDLMVPYAVRFTWSGAYLHAASWSTGSQGFSNVSHGCINLAPEAGKAYYEMAVPGDPVTVIGSPKAGKWDNGWTMWFLSWKDLLKGSALHRAVIADKDGSRFVKPSQVKPWKLRPPLWSPAARNAEAD